MPLFTKTFGLVAGALVVPVFGASIIAANYGYPFLTHLIDVVQGNNTVTVESTNAPNWGRATSMFVPLFSSSATTSTGTAATGLASSTTYTFAIEAFDGNGTTTISAPVTVTTDASNTQAYPEAITLSWSPIAGATGYGICFATSTTITGQSQMFYATTSNQYTFATSTNSIYNPCTNTDTTAFSNIINPIGPTVFNGFNLTATTTKAASTTAVQINGAVVITANATTSACYADTAGTIFYNKANSHEWGCNGVSWSKIF